MNQHTTPGWVRELLSAIDAQDPVAFASFLTEDVRFVFGNAPTVRGRNDTREMMAGFFKSVGGLEHLLERSWLCDDTLICKGRLPSPRHEGSTLTVPFCQILGLREGRIADYQIYCDMSALYA